MPIFTIRDPFNCHEDHIEAKTWQEAVTEYAKEYLDAGDEMSILLSSGKKQIGVHVTTETHYALKPIPVSQAEKDSGEWSECNDCDGDDDY